MGGLRERDASRRGGRRHDARRHAAQQHPGDDDSRRARSASGMRRPGEGSSTAGSGAASCPATPASSARLLDAGACGVKAFLGPLRDRRLSGRGRAASCARRCRARRAWGAAPRSRRAGDGRGAAAGRPAPLRDLPRLASSVLGARGSGAAARLCRELRAPVHVVHLSAAVGVAARRRGPSRGAAAHGRDLPALPRARGRGDRGRPHGVQVRAAGARAREPRRPLGRALGRHDRPRGVRSLAVSAAPEGGRAGRLHGRVGRHRVAAARAAGRLDRGAGAGDRTRAARELDGGGPRAARGPRKAARAGSPPATTPTSSCSTPTRRSSSRPRRLHHRHKLTPYLGRTLRGVVRQTWLRGAACLPRRRASRARLRGALVSASPMDNH